MPTAWESARRRRDRNTPSARRLETRPFEAHPNRHPMRYPFQPVPGNHPSVRSRPPRRCSLSESSLAHDLLPVILAFGTQNRLFSVATASRRGHPPGASTGTRGPSGSRCAPMARSFRTRIGAVWFFPSGRLTNHPFGLRECRHPVPTRTGGPAIQPHRNLPLWGDSPCYVFEPSRSWLASRRRLFLVHPPSRLPPRSMCCSSGTAVTIDRLTELNSSSR